MHHWAIALCISDSSTLAIHTKTLMMSSAAQMMSLFGITLFQLNFHLKKSILLLEPFVYKNYQLWKVCNDETKMGDCSFNFLDVIEWLIYQISFNFNLNRKLHIFLLLAVAAIISNVKWEWRSQQDWNCDFVVCNNFCQRF